MLRETTGDTSFIDLTGDYKIVMSASPEFYPHRTKKGDTIWSDVSSFRVAVIPLNAIGNKQIAWYDNLKQFSTETEGEFENEMLHCIIGKDTSQVHTEKRNNYCLRTGYGDGGMGKWSLLYFC